MLLVLISLLSLLWFEVLICYARLSHSLFSLQRSLRAAVLFYTHTVTDTRSMHMTRPPQSCFSCKNPQTYTDSSAAAVVLLLFSHMLSCFLVVWQRHEHDAHSSSCRSSSITVITIKSRVEQERRHQKEQRVLVCSLIFS